MNAHQFDSDWDYQDALYPDQAAYESWLEGNLAQALQGNVDAVVDEVYDDDAAMLTTKAVAVVAGGTSLSQNAFAPLRGLLSVEGSIDRGEVDIAPLVGFALTGDRLGLPARLVATLDALRELIIASAPGWAFVEAAFKEGRS